MKHILLNRNSMCFFDKFYQVKYLNYIKNYIIIALWLGETNYRAMIIKNNFF